ncbi:hypothetical protein BT63DRAFT_460729 [Microthyrium microscopicum]|uniref:Uncharacterized protein n=1 Tax=Microthyrium microscopicum TaxID=703497 RepID=A0A6A6TVW8_9PEZI|nr:hypothetical protein BT63DRAFT_460729 [Microthyrium microscopicum]
MLSPVILIPFTRVKSFRALCIPIPRLREGEFDEDPVDLRNDSPELNWTLQWSKLDAETAGIFKVLKKDVVDRE